MIRLPALPSKGTRVLAHIRPITPGDGRYYKPQLGNDEIQFVTSATPVSVIQKTDTTCWAAAMDSLFQLTLPLAIPLSASSNTSYSEDNNIAQVTNEEETIKKNHLQTSMLPLLNRPGMDLRTAWPDMSQVNYVYDTVFKLPVASFIQANTLKAKLVEWVSANKVPLLTYSEGKHSWRKDTGWSWHALIIWIVAEANGGTELWVKAMDPASGKYLACKLEETMGGATEWFYYGTTRLVGEPEPSPQTS